MKQGKGHIDWIILLLTIGLMLFSVAFVYSASSTISELKFGSTESLFLNHAVRVGVAIVVMLIFAKMDYRLWRRWSYLFMLINIALLIVVLAVGFSAKGASRWISLGPLSFQPSEMAKWALIIHIANLLANKQEFIKSFEKGFLPFMFWAAIICGLIALQPNFSTMAVIFGISLIMMFIGNVNLLYLGGLGIAGAFFLGLFAIAAPYRVARLTAFMSGGDPSNGASYQLNQALLTLGNGGVAGVGPGQSRQSHLFLPEAYGDFIFSIIGEEWGFIGLTVMLLSFVIIFWRGMKVAKKAPDNFGYFLASGIIVTFAVYVVVNAGVNTGLLPTTGVPMPFISYGGTAVIFYAAAMGILLNISAHSGVYPRKENASEPEEESTL